jgi:hypothetical protein
MPATKNLTSQFPARNLRDVTVVTGGRERDGTTGESARRGVLAVFGPQQERQKSEDGESDRNHTVLVVVGLVTVPLTGTASSTATAMDGRRVGRLPKSTKQR